MTAILLVVLGVFLAVRLLAALYGVLDRWYAREREWPRMLRDLVFWAAVIAAIAVVVADPLPLFWGIGAYAVFYVGVYALIALKVRSLLRS